METNTAQSELFEAIIQRLAAIGMPEMTTSKEGIDAVFVELEDSIKQFMAEITDFFSKLETNILQIIDILKKEDVRKLASNTEKCEALQSEVKTLSSDLQNIHKTKTTSISTAATQTAMAKLESLEASLNKIKQDGKITRYTFQPEKQIFAMMDNIGTLGLISRLQTDLLESSDEIKNKQAKHVADINIKLPTDSMLRSCMITGSALLSDGYMAITDCINWKVKLINTQQKEIKSELALSSWPYAITDVDNTKVAVTLPAESKVQFLSMKDSYTRLAEGVKVDVDGVCRCLAHINGTLIITFVDPPKVEIVDFNGMMLKRISTDRHGQPLFQYPKHIAVSPTKSSMYICDKYSNSVIRLALDGKVTATYKYNTLMGPSGIAIDDMDGTLFVCCLKSHTIHHIGLSAEDGKVLLGWDKGVSYPYALSYCNKEHKLYVAMYNNEIKVYQIQYL